MYALKFIKFLFEIRNVKTITIKNKPEMIVGTVKEKYQFILNKFVIKKYDSVAENIREVKIICKNIKRSRNEVK